MVYRTQHVESYIGSYLLGTPQLFIQSTMSSTPPPLRAFACFCFTVNYRQTLITTCFAKILQVLYLVHYYHTIHRTGVLYTEKSSLLLFVSVIHKLFLQVCELYITILAGDG